MWLTRATYNLICCFLLSFSTHRLLLVESSSSGAASSIFSSRGGSKPGRNDNMNRDFYNQLDDWYDPIANNITKIPDEQLLIGRLFRNYDPASRPVFNASKPVIVKFGLAFIQICDMVTDDLVKKF